jgi:hypothetical protein
MFWISIAALGAVHYFYRRGLQAEMAADMEVRASEPKPETEAVQASISETEEPWESSDKKRTPHSAETLGNFSSEVPKEKTTESKDPLDLYANLEGIVDPLERHRIYTQGIDLAYREKNSGDSAMRKKAKSFAQSYVGEFHRFKDVVFKDLGDSRNVTVFKQLAILYEDDQEYDKALSLCNQALLLDLKDGTKTGYQGRIDRLKKKMME